VIGRKKHEPEPRQRPARTLGGKRFATVLADPPWQFQNRTGKVAPEHRRLSRYGTMDLEAICALPVAECVADTAHLYLWVPNALLPAGLQVLQRWGFEYKSNVVWHKVRKDGGPDGRGVGFYFRNVTELVLFGVRGKNARTWSCSPAARGRAGPPGATRPRRTRRIGQRTRTTRSPALRRRRHRSPSCC
jgi:N6-adenosine-specific RNA methylase IME4